MSKRTIHRKLARVLPFSALAAIAVACSSPERPNKLQTPEPVTLPAGQNAHGELRIPSGSLPSRQTDDSYRLPTGQLVASKTVGGETHIQIVGTLSPAAFDDVLKHSRSRGLDLKEQTALIRHGIHASLELIDAKAKLNQVKIYPEVGYFSAWLPLSSYDQLEEVGSLPLGLILNPSVLDESKKPALPNRLNEVSSDGRLDTVGFSGLTRIGEVEFRQLVKSEIGVEPDGSSVLVGITDTGIAFNHPSFFDEKGQTRISHMKEFTGEGTAFFVESARFEVRIPSAEEVEGNPNPDEALFLTAEYLTPINGMGTQPKADERMLLENKLILVNSELRERLTQAGSGARLGLIPESAFASPSESVDINQNGQTDDTLWVIMIPGETAAAHDFYVSLSGDGDFRHSASVSDWNTTQETVTAYAEKFGFDVRNIELLDKEGQTVPAIQAGLVGFDPGNHGSHVAGIIAGRKTISNDSNDTLARGVAPAARIAMNRVCANNGGCAATEAFIDLAQNGADVINMSLGGLGAFNDGFDVQALMINRLTQVYNTLFVISAGNSGPGHNTVGSPSVARLSLSVGATATRSMIERQYQWPGSGKSSNSDDTSEDFMLFFSSRGPTAAGGFKPSLSAPGTELSAVQLNGAAGARSGLDVYWGTSMAAPTAAGAYALLLDAIRKYNGSHPNQPLSEDALVLRRILMESARAFDVKKYNPITGEKTEGQYTWIDQGTGMINLAEAWKLVKKVSMEQVPPSITVPLNPADESSPKAPLALDYEVRVLRKNPNGISYDGSLPTYSPIADDPAKSTISPRIGTGIWLTDNSPESLIEVQIARRLSEKALQRQDAGELHRALVTTADDFDLVTEIYGSDINWLAAGSLNSLDCTAGTVVPKVKVIGEGAVDVPGESETAPGTSIGMRPSNVYVCVDRQKVKALQPGDHGAVIKAYRTAGGLRESVPSFLIPVYMTVPQQRMENQNSFSASGIVKSFEVARHYVDVPEGTTLIRVNLEVPEAAVRENGQLACSGVALYALEGGNTLRPPEFANRSNSLAVNCTNGGVPIADIETRSVSYERTSPKAGIWDLHVFGRYNFASSAYSLKIDYANLSSNIDEISGTAEVLSGTFDLKVNSSSFEVIPSETSSTFQLGSLARTNTYSVQKGEFFQVPDSEGQVYRSFEEGISAVTVSTFGAPASDIDLQVLECTDQNEEDCKIVASSGTPTDLESATFTPQIDSFYVVVVHGYSVDGERTEFQLKEELFLNESDTGTLNITETGDHEFSVVYHLEASTSKVMQQERFLSGKYSAAGTLSIRSEKGTLLATLPVMVQK